MKTNAIKGGWITLNRACNLMCPWCYAISDRINSKENMSIELAEKLLLFFSSLEVKNVILIGGEPTIYPRILETIRFAKKNGISPILVTNGRKLSDQSFFQSITEAGISDITISLKAYNGSSYDKYLPGQGQRVYSEICAAILNAKRLKKPINISVTLFRQMSSNLRELVSTLVDLNPDSVSIDMGSPVVVGENVESVDLLTPTELARTTEDLHELLKHTGIKYGFYITIPLCLFKKHVLDDIISCGKILTTCHVPKGNGLVFTQDGHVIMCNHLSSQPIGRFGVDFCNAQQFETFWSSEKIQMIRSCFSCYPHQKCQSCEMWDKCGGGCFVKWLHWNPRNFIS